MNHCVCICMGSTCHWAAQIRVNTVYDLTTKSWPLSSFHRAALDNAARTPPFSRNLRSTSRHTTATTGGRTNIYCREPPHCWPKLEGGSSLLPQTVSKYKLPLPPAEIPSPVSWPSTPAALTACQRRCCAERTSTVMMHGWMDVWEGGTGGA